jgi:hypothetical protein
MIDPLETWPEFMARVHARMQAGAKEYGAVSFSREPAGLSGEIEQELLDVCGWSFILNDYTRVLWKSSKQRSQNVNRTGTRLIANPAMNILIRRLGKRIGA